LLELLVAATVMTMAVLGSLSAHAGSQNLTRSARETGRAVSDLQAAMEGLLLVPLEDVVDAAGPWAPGAPVAEFEGLHLRGERIVTTYPNYDGGTVPDPLEVVLTVTWLDPRGGTRTLSLSTLKTQ